MKKGHSSGRERTRYPGVFTRKNETGDTVFYIRYRRGGRGTKEICEPVGKSSCGMTAAKASYIRIARIEKRESSNREQRAAMSVAKEKSVNVRWTLTKLWAAYKEANPKDENNCTRATEEWIFSRQLQKPFGSKTVDELSTADIDRFRNQLTKKGLKPATIRNAMELMRRLFNFGDKQGYCVVPRTLHFNFPHIDNEKTEMLTDDEMLRYLRALEEYTSYKFADEKVYFIAYGKLIMHTGIRRKAAIALRWDDCDFEKGFITLRGATAKNKKTQRIPMSPFVKDLLGSLPHGNGEYVFPQRHEDTYTGYLRRVCDYAGLPKDFRPIHGLRHNFASRIASSGKVDLYTLQNLMTHSSPAMTQRYAHLADKAMHNAAVVIDDVMTVQEKTEEAAARIEVA